MQSVLILYVRNGCCLCEGLESRLRKLPLHFLNPPLELSVIDIDGADVQESVRARFDLKVPVLLFGPMTDQKTFVELPRVSPRLQEEALFGWLQKIILKHLGQH